MYTMVDHKYHNIDASRWNLGYGFSPNERIAGTLAPRGGVG